MSYDKYITEWDTCCKTCLLKKQTVAKSGRSRGCMYNERSLGNSIRGGAMDTNTMEAVGFEGGVVHITG